MIDAIVHLAGREVIVYVRDEPHLPGQPVEADRTVRLTIRERDVDGNALRLIGTPSQLERLGEVIVRQAKSVHERADPPPLGEVVEP